VLDGNSSFVQIVRIRREGNVNRITRLDNQRIRKLWSDPLLRYSNVLDGLFHEAVVVTESDSDARFYAAVSDALFEARSSAVRKPDVMFIHGGGKARLPMIVRSLRELGVPVKAAADFDILNAESPLAELVDAAGGKWDELKGDWMAVKKSVDSKKPDLSSEVVKKSISEILTGVTTPNFQLESKSVINKVLRKSSPWAHAKSIGKAFVPSGDSTQTCNRLLAKLREIGIFVVEVGELEGFFREVGSHGPSWVNEVLKRNLLMEPKLEDARTFVKALVGEVPPTSVAVQPTIGIDASAPHV
ncbi:MAG: ATP-dependent nuclease, partial [Gammaproteobacteria bacterium]